MCLFIGGYTSLPPLDVHIKESYVEIWMGSKGGMLKTLIGLRKIAESRCSGIIEDPQCPNHSSSLSLRRLATGRLVNDEGIGLKLLGQANRFAFAHIKISQRGIERDRNRSHFKPCGMRSHPHLDLGRCPFLLQLAKHGLRNDDVCVQLGKHGNMINQDKIIDRGCVGDNNANSACACLIA